MRAKSFMWTGGQQPSWGPGSRDPLVGGGGSGSDHRHERVVAPGVGQDLFEEILVGG